MHLREHVQVLLHEEEERLGQELLPYEQQMCLGTSQPGVDACRFLESSEVFINLVESGELITPKSRVTY